ncbi:hypothetical protein NORO109296_26285 [Nocardiopsis rhodophaea]
MGAQLLHDSGQSAPRRFDLAVDGQQAEVVLQLREVGQGAVDVVRAPPGHSPHVGAGGDVAHGGLGEVGGRPWRDVRPGRAHLLEPDRTSRVRGPGSGQLHQVFGVVQGGRAGGAVPLRRPVEHPRVHGGGGAATHGVLGGEGVAVEVPDLVVLRVQVEAVGGAVLARLEHPVQPRRGAGGVHPVRVGVGVTRELVDLVAHGHAEEVGAVGQCRGEGAQVGLDTADGVGVGEEVAALPGAGPGGEEVDAGQVPLHPVDGDVEPARGGGVDQAPQLLDGARSDERPVGLEHRPHREDPDVVEAEGGDRFQVGADLADVEVQPVVEPAARGRVVGPEPQRAGDAAGRRRLRGLGGRVRHPLMAPSLTPRKK